MEMMKLADVFLWLDDVQFSKGSFTNRIQVKLPGGRRWMSVPLKGKGAFTPIRELEPAGEEWRGSHRSMLRASLGEALHVASAMAVFDAALQRGKLCDLLIASCEEQAGALGALPPRIARTSEIDVPGTSGQRVIDLVRGRADALRFRRGRRGLSGPRGVRASRLAGFAHGYDPAPWPQAHGEFTPFVSSLDLIAARGSEAGGHLSPGVVPWRDRLAEMERRNGAPD